MLTGEELTNPNNLNLISKIHCFMVLTSSSLIRKSIITFLNEVTDISSFHKFKYKVV